MGKTTLCNAITGLVPARGSIRLLGEEILGLAPHVITAKGIGYVPQGRRVWPSLSVDEHLRLAARASRGPWTPQRVYQTFPRLAERKGNGGAQLSGGEQQMLAIARALLFNPRLLVMDEPTEGLAPVIVEQVANMLSHARRRWRDRRAADRAEPRRRDRRRRHRRRDDERSHHALDARRRACRGSRAAAAPARHSHRTGRRACAGRRAERARRSTARLHRPSCGRTRDDAKRAPAAPHRRTAHRSRLHALERGGQQRKAARPARRAARGAGNADAVDRRCSHAACANRSRCTRRRVPGRGEHGARGLRRGHVRHQGPRAHVHPRLPREAGRAHGDRGSRDVGQAFAGDGASARGGASPPEGRARRVHRRSRIVGRGDGGGVRALRHAAARPRRHRVRRRFRRHRAGDGRDATPAGRRSEGDGLDGRVRRREALRRPGRHLHDVLGDRHRRHQPDLRARAGQRRACARRHDRVRTRRHRSKATRGQHSA